MISLHRNPPISPLTSTKRRCLFVVLLWTQGTWASEFHLVYSIYIKLSSFWALLKHLYLFFWSTKLLGRPLFHAFSGSRTWIRNIINNANLCHVFFKEDETMGKRTKISLPVYYDGIWCWFVFFCFKCFGLYWERMPVLILQKSVKQSNSNNSKSNNRKKTQTQVFNLRYRVHCQWATDSTHLWKVADEYVR